MKNIIKNKIEGGFFNKARFCTPGHKGREAVFDRECAKHDKYLDYDVTEIEDEFPCDAIALAESKTAKLLNIPHLRFLVNGSSVGIKAALYSLGTSSGDILATKNIHPAIKHSAILLGAKIFYCDSLYPDEKEIRAAIKKYPSIETVVFTSPDYYGVTIKEGTGQAVVDMGKRLFIDAAHGAHFLFRPDLFDCGLFKHAFAFNLSAHKTLPSYTQTAYLAINDKKYLESIDKCLEILGTTSPSYPFYMSLEMAADYTHQHKQHYDNLYNAVQQFKKSIDCMPNDDFSRIVVTCKDGGALYKKLLNKGMVAEKYDETRVIFIVSIMDKKEDIEKLCQAILSED